MGWLPFLIVLPLLVLIQQLVPGRLGKVVRVGDEKDYIDCGGRPDPYAPAQFLRVPLMTWLSRQTHRYSDNPEAALRSASSAASLLSILAGMLSAQLLGGPMAALILGLVLTLMPGRIILSHHIWPDIWLGLWLSLACLVLIYPDLPPDLRALLLGGIATLAFLTRFDALLLAPFSGFALAPLSVWHWVLILLPTLTAFALLSIRNARRHQIPWPDNTWMFNLMISAAETKRDQSEPVLVEQEVFEVSTVWKRLSQQHRLDTSVTSVRQLLLRPLRTLRGLATRFWASLGPDSFILFRLLPPAGAAYPDIPAGLNRGLAMALTLAFPVFSAATLLALLVSKPAPPIFIWPTLAMALGSLIHNRTRYRQAWLPGAALLLAPAIGEPGFWAQLFGSEAALAWFISIGLASALIWFPVRPDIKKIP
jgi:hypothetical protein